MALFNDLVNNRDVRAAWTYGRHWLRGPLVKHVEEFVGTEKQVTWRFNLGIGEWHECEGMWYDGWALAAGTNYHFHAGGAADAPDAFFPSDDPLPGYAYNSVRPPQAMAADGDPDKVFGIYKGLKLPHYDASGFLRQASGAAIPDGSDPRSYYTYSASPVRVIADAMRRGGAMKRWRVSSADASSNSFTAAGHGLADYDQVRFFTAGTLPAGLEAGRDYYVVNAGVSTFQVSALFGGAAVDVTSAGSGGLYVGSLRPRLHWSDWHHKHDFDAFEIEWEETEGEDPVLVPRFEAHLFFVPPFRLSQVVDRVCEITCSDWQRANGRVRLFTPEPRAVTYVFDQTKIGDGSFKTRAVPARQKPNRIRVDFRDFDAAFLQQAGEEGACEPVVVTRGALVSAAGGNVSEQQVNGGVMRRSQAERVGHFYARRNIDSDQETEIDGAPSAYKTLPADVGQFEHPVPGWTDAKFLLMLKEEDDHGKLGYRLFGRLYSEAWYSDTDQSPVTRALPGDRPNPYAEPDQVSNLQLDEEGGFTTDGGWQPKILASFDFGEHALQQFARVEYRRTGDVQWKLGGTAEKPLGSSSVVVAIAGVEKTTYEVRVIASTRFTSAPLSGAATDTITVTATPPAVMPQNPAYFYDSHGNLYVTWDPGTRPAGVLAQGEEVPRYKVSAKMGGFGGTLKRGPVPVDTIPDVKAAWEVFTLLSFPCTTPPAPDEAGGASHPGHASQVGCVLHSQVFRNDSEVRLQVGEKCPPREVRIINHPSGTATQLYWQTTEVSGTPRVTAGNTGYTRRPLPNDVLAIRISRRTAEYLVNGQVVARDSELPLDGAYRVEMVFGLLSGAAQEAKSVTIRPSEPEIFYYSADQMGADGFAPGVDTVYVQIVTVSNNPSADDSDPLEIACIP